jgi:formate--tetrahydrofolate ligase
VTSADSLIATTAVSIGLDPATLELFGSNKAKVPLRLLRERSPRGKIILVSSMTPTALGEGKTTISIGLAQGMKKMGCRAALALRQPSMGPVFGRKGGGTGAGRSTLVPADDINLHFTGDFHAITMAHNLLAAAIDNRLHHRATRLDSQNVTWKRVLDINDRALRRIVIGREGQGVERASGFDITAASEIMAALCLAGSMDDLRARLDRMVVGFTPDNEPVFAEEIRVTGALLAILRHALKPNLAQSLEGVAAFVHGGPFANIAHGCNSLLATRMALVCADYVITEAGFGFELGGEKFIDIKCRQSGLSPAVVVLVATVRALKLHGGKASNELTVPDPAATERGLENLAAHLDLAGRFQLQTVVALNQFADDSPEELAVVHSFCRARGVRCATANVFAHGGDGARELAQLVVAAAAKPSPPLQPLYPLQDPAQEKVRKIAVEMYGADGLTLTEEAQGKLALLERCGFGQLPICMAKTQNSLSDNPKLLGRPKAFRITVRDFEVAHGAGFLVALTGDILRMPALPKAPAAERINVDAEGQVIGV